MAKIDLNIVDRGVQGTDWIAEDIGLTSSHLDKVLEIKTDNSSALNSLPTPFARFFVAREAFRRVTEEHIDSSCEKEAGFAYRQLVSDILDIYELLFNLKYHQNNTWKDGQKIELREWKRKENLEYLKQQMPILYNSISQYYTTDIQEDSLYFLIYTENGKEKLLACTSPMTGFITPPDMDKSIIRERGTSSMRFLGEQYNELHIQRKSSGEYFRDTKMFEDRDADFKNYMYNELFGADDIKPQFKYIKEYIRSFANDKDIRNDIRPKLDFIRTDQNSSLKVNGLSIMCCDEIDVSSYFTESIIRVPYRISRDRFNAVKYRNDASNRDYDYLLPFKPEVLNLFEDGVIDSEIDINRNSVTVFLRYKGKEYKREYAIDTYKSNLGRILDLRSDNINFNLGIFPNILSHKEVENNYFKVLVVAADENPNTPNFNIDKIELSFYKRFGNEIRQIQEIAPTEAKFGVLPSVVRSRQKTDEVECGTKFYELFNSAFDVIQISIFGHTSFVITNWERSQATTEKFSYAIDLGTSNTFISRNKIGANNRPELFKMERPMVSYLHEVPIDMQRSLSKCIETSIFDKARNKIKTEFVPPIIDGSDYCFPIRTALCGIKTKTENPSLFDNCNIAFFYEKLMSNEDQNIHTDIKWEKNDDMLRVFIRELLLIIKCDILQRNGDLDCTNLIWFRPLSFMGNIREAYNRIWTKEPQSILLINPSQIACFSESEAPYYYFRKMDYIKNSDAVTVVDIGGGSTDLVYFKDNLPLMANSVHFGCDILWGNGLVEFDDVQDNGIYKKYENTLRFMSDDLEKLNEHFKKIPNVKTKDIINFWLSNDEYCDIRKNLNADFKPVFIYHLTSILYYMSCMYKDYGLTAPKTIIFSGNGSKYIDGFICADKRVLKKIINLVFNSVFGEEHNVNLELPTERKEATCYGGLFRDADAEDVPEKVYQGDINHNYETVGHIDNNFSDLKQALLDKYANLASLYEKVLHLLKQENVIDKTADTNRYVAISEENMGTLLSTYYKSQVRERYSDEVIMNDSIFFLPIINRIIEMTKL